MTKLSLFIPLSKVDTSKRLVYGVATAEIEDRAGEICDYASTKPHYEAWSQEIARSTRGKSLGNLRAMHGQVAAGKVTAITFDDEAKQIGICAKIVDEAEWLKVVEGVYTGFSQGGIYERRWTDEKGYTRYTAVPNEISLVDLPCLREATFELVKADGTTELREFGPKAECDAHFARLVEDLEWLKEKLASEEFPESENPKLLAELSDIVERLMSLLGTVEYHNRDARPYGDVGPSSIVQRSFDAGKIQKDRKRSRVPPADKSVDEERNESRFEHVPSAPQGASSNDEWMIRSLLQKRLDSLTTTLGDVLDRVKKIEQQPLPLPFAGAPRPISKHEDGLTEAPTCDPMEQLLSDPDALSVLAIKLAQRNGRSHRR